MTNKQLKLTNQENQYLQMYQEYVKNNTITAQELSPNMTFEIGKTKSDMKWFGTKNGFLSILKIESTYHYNVQRRLFGINLNNLFPYFLKKSPLGYSARSFFSPLIKESISPSIHTNVHYCVYDRSDDKTVMTFVSAGVCSIEDFLKMTPSYLSFSENLQSARNKVLSTK